MSFKTKKARSRDVTNFNLFPGMKEASNFHEFCRLLARVQNTYHISKLVNIDAYLDWITSVARFTVDSLGNIQVLYLIYF